MNTVLTDIGKIEKNYLLLDVSVMNDSPMKVLLWICVPSSGILCKPVSEKREKLKAENVTPIKVHACVEAMHVKMKDYSEKIDSLRKATIECEEDYSDSDESTVFQGYEL